VISASRRTDIPAFYLEWFMAEVARGAFTVENPYNRQRREVPIAPGAVHSIVFWSKNYGPFLAGEIGQRLRDMGYGLFFNFTLNSPEARLEPRVPPLAERLSQMATLAKRFGPDSLHWRHDPICFFRIDGGRLQTNLSAFETIARRAAAVGIRHCLTSFCDDYRKIRRRLGPSDPLTLGFPGVEAQVPVLEKMLAVLEPLGMGLHTCCEKRLLDRLPAGIKVTAGRCIDHDRLERLYGGRLSHRVDSGQRRSAGCGCHRSVDIGSYRLHPCRHNCLYCYANPAGDGANS
jgi:hypothetical protein